MDDSAESIDPHIVYDNSDKVPLSNSAALAMASDSSDLGSDIGNQSCDEFEENVEYLVSNSNLPPDRSPLLRHVILHAASSQLERLRDRTSLGRPTAIAVSSYLAVGTSTSVVLIFDSKQVLKCCLADKRLNDYGAVSCLGFSTSGDRLIAGHARGHIALWDVVSARLLVCANDFHLPDCPILHARFTPLPPVAVVSDTSGSVFGLSFAGSGSSSSSCLSRLLFSGARGEALYFDVLSTATLQYCVKRLPFVDSVVVVIVTVASVIISTFAPSAGSISKLLRVDMPSIDLTSPPVSCWCPSLDPTNIFQVDQLEEAPNRHKRGKRAENFMFRLCVARGSLLKYFQLCGSKATSRLSISHWGDTSATSLHLPSDILWMCWPKADFQLVLDVDERLHVLSTVSMSDTIAPVPTRLNTIDLSGVGIIYASGAFFKATATGNAVSRAMAAVGEHACYSSITCCNGQLFLLGTSGIHVLTPRALADRVKQLIECGDRQGAVQVLLNTHQAPTSVRPPWLDERLLDLLAELSATPTNQIRPNDLKSIKELASICIKKLVGAPDILSSMVSSIQSPDVKPIFCDHLLTFAKEHSSENNPIDCFPPQVVQFMFDTLSTNRNRFEDLAQFLCFVDITLLDLDRAIRFTLKQGLYMPYIRLYWEALGDWRTPLVTLLDAVVVVQFKATSNKPNPASSSEPTRKSSFSVASHASSSVSPTSFSPPTGQPDPHAAISTLLDFIDCLLARLYYPSRQTCPTFSESDRLEAFDVLCSRLPSSAVSAEFPTTNSKDSGFTTSSTYAYLKALLFSSPDRLMTLLSAVLDSACTESPDASWNSRRQLLVDIIFEILESISSNGSPKTPNGSETHSISGDNFNSGNGADGLANVRIACYTFAVQELTVSAGRQARLLGDGFQRLVRGLFNIYADPRAEAALFVLFRAGMLEGFCSDAELLAMAEQAMFFDLAGAVCTRHGWRARMLRYYLCVPAWVPNVFDFLIESLTIVNSELSPSSSSPSSSRGSDKSALLDMCCTYAKQLVAADSVRAARFVSDYLWDEERRRESFLEQLRQSGSRPLYTILVKLRRSLDSRLLVERVVLAAQIECEQLAAHNQVNNDPDSALKEAYTAEDDIDEDDDQIEQIVRAVPGNMVNDCLKLCSQKRSKISIPLRGADKALDGSFVECLILVENGQCNDAILMALKSVKRWLNMTIAEPTSAWTAHKLDLAVRRLLRIAAKAKSINPDAKPEVPSQLLADLFCVLESESAASPRLSSVVSALCSLFSPSVIIEAVLRDPGSGNSFDRPPPCLGAIRRLLTTVLSLSDDEITAFSSMREIYADELHSAYRQFRILGSRGIRLTSSSLRCCVCRRTPDEDKILVFGCDHIAHQACCVLPPAQSAGSNVTNPTGRTSDVGLAIPRSSSSHSMARSPSSHSVTQLASSASLQTLATSPRRQQQQQPPEKKPKQPEKPKADVLIYCPVCASPPVQSPKQ